MKLRECLAKDGYVFLEEYRPNDSTTVLLRSLATEEKMERISDIHHLTPNKKNLSKPNTYSGLHGHEEFPAHTDLAHWISPPHYILLRCGEGNKQVATRLIDGNQLVETLGTRCLERALVRPRRRGKDKKMQLMRIFNQGAPSLFRWDETFIIPASPAGELGVKAVANMLKDIKAIEIRLCNTFDTLLIDNWRMLHGRSRIPPGCENRVIERVYLGEAE